MAKTVFYCRVSTRDQRTDSQIAAARKLGVKDEHIFVEKASGVRHDRPELDKALAALEAGDTLACWKLDRIGRSLIHLQKILDDLEQRGVFFLSTSDGLNTQAGSLTGRMLIDLMSVIAKFERGLILERTRAGLEAARARGATFGRRRKLAPQDVSTAKRLLAKGDADENAATVAKRLGVSRRTLFRNLREQRDREKVGQEAAE